MVNVLKQNDLNFKLIRENSVFDYIYLNDPNLNISFGVSLIHTYMIIRVCIRYTGFKFKFHNHSNQLRYHNKYLMNPIFDVNFFYFEQNFCSTFLNGPTESHKRYHTTYVEPTTHHPGHSWPCRETMGGGICSCSACSQMMCSNIVMLAMNS